MLALVPALVFAHEPDRFGLDWLVGCWVNADGSAQEVWVAESGKSLLGFGVGITDGKVGFYEVLSIKRGDDGSWILTAHPSGQATASFHAVQISENSIVFANPEHDYPQEIGYRREGNRLTATVSLLDGANPGSFEKVACGAED
jgi:hypothetical protein